MLTSMYQIIGAKLSEEKIKSGSNAGENYLLLRVKKLGDTQNDGREVPVFAKDFIREFNQAGMEGREPDWDKCLGGAVFDSEEISLGGLFHHFSMDNGQKKYTVDAAGNPVIYSKIKVLVLWQPRMVPTLDQNGLPKFLGFNPVTGDPVYAPPHMETYLDEKTGVWLPKRYYLDGWSPEERRDNALKTFFEKIGAAQTIEEPAASGFTLEAPQPAQQPAQATVQPMQQPAVQQGEAVTPPV